MRVAVGVDIVEVSRVRRLIEDHPTAENEIFTAAELDYCAARRNRYAHLAARFAAKEAVLKALGTGLGPGLRWTDVEVRNDPLGRPRVHLHGLAKDQARALDARAEISLSHTREHAVAYAALVIPTEPPAVPAAPTQRTCHALPPDRPDRPDRAEPACPRAQDHLAS